MNYCTHCEKEIFWTGARWEHVGKATRWHQCRSTYAEPDDGVMTVAEVADKMRLAKMTVYRAIEAGKLDAIRLGRSYRIPRKSYLRWLAEARGETPD